MYIFAYTPRREVVRSRNESLAMFTCNDFCQSEWILSKCRLFMNSLYDQALANVHRKYLFTRTYIYMQVGPNLRAFEEWTFTTILEWERREEVERTGRWSQSMVLTELSFNLLKRTSNSDRYHSEVLAERPFQSSFNLLNIFYLSFIYYNDFFC